MSDFDKLLNEDVIGRAADLENAPAEKVPPPRAEPVHALVPIEVLERPSPTPFRGRPDVDYPELDSGESPYVPRFLVRKWGADKFLRSAYYALWKSEAERGARLAVDAKPSGKKK